MEKKIQLTHPQGKKAVSMAPDKYNLLKGALLNCLKSGGELTHTEIGQVVAEELKNNKVKFDGNVNWHLEWVKLDLEANGIIERVPQTSPQKYIIAKSGS